jgi:hypothetical protein
MRRKRNGLRLVSSVEGERRGHPRHEIDGAAHLVASDGRIHHVRLVDLSVGGALISRPQHADLFMHMNFTLAGSAMPWERQAVVVRMSEHGLHLKFI